jgi:nucleotide-binding universal stress UspA family protein
MSTLLLPTDVPEVGLRAFKSSPVVVATDGREQSDPALIAGRLLAGDAPDAMRVVTVVRAVPAISPESRLAVSPDLEATRRAAQKHVVLEQMKRLWASDAPNTAEVYDGDPAATIAMLARDSNASLIVAGLGRHRVFDRLFGDETALRLIRLSGVPVLATAPGLTHAPRRIVAAVDFSETSLRAVRLALELAAPEAIVYLTHVAPRDASPFDWNTPGGSYRDDAGYALKKFRDQLQVPDGMSVQRILLHGDPATELLAFATSVHADLIATGSHGHGFVARMLIGSVTTRILRCATCSVLTIPHLAAMTRARTSAQPPVATPVAQPEWASQLDAFTRRNIGRRSSLEVDDPEIGAQAQEHDYPLLGAAFDTHDCRVELMLGELGDVGRHLTRGIGGVSRIDILKDDSGRDIALRIAHGFGQTLLTFVE